MIFFVCATQNKNSEQPTKHKIGLKTCLQNYFENSYETRIFFQK